MARKKAVKKGLLEKVNPFYLIGGGILTLFALNALSNFLPEMSLDSLKVNAQTSSETSLEALARIQAEHKIINVHEHVEDEKQVPNLLKCMDELGMARTILVGSSWFTITLNDKVGFTRYDENNENILNIALKYPKHFEAWPTIDPMDPDKLTKIKQLLARGAVGVKMYTGHGYVRRDTGDYMFHTQAMDDPAMYPFYEYCEDNYVPLCWHVNPFKPGFAQELIEVLTAFPDMKVNCPHYILSSINDARLREFLSTFPNVYTDISFGHDDFLTDGLERISKNTAKFRDLFSTYPDRFIFGTDLVMTNIPSKTVEFFETRTQAYYDMLTKDKYTTPLIPGKELNGLSLPPELLENVLYKNYERFLEMKPEGTKITRQINWNNMGVKKLDRRFGQAFPPK